MSSEVSKGPNASVNVEKDMERNIPSEAVLIKEIIEEESVKTKEFVLKYEANSLAEENEHLNHQIMNIKKENYTITYEDLPNIVKCENGEVKTELGLDISDVVKSELTEEVDVKDEILIKAEMSPGETEQSYSPELVTDIGTLLREALHEGNMTAKEEKTTENIPSNIHNEENPFQCEICLKSFAKKGYLRRHKKRHAGHKPFHCELCSTSFTSSSSLKVHKNTHTGEKLFRCKHCPKTFSRSYCLRVHETIHTGEKPYECAYCWKCFRLKSVLHLHEKMHRGESTYRCNVCSKPFYSRSLFNKHVTVHYSESELPSKSNDFEKKQENSYPVIVKPE